MEVVPAQRRFNFGLRSLFLFVTVCGVWLAYFNNRAQISYLGSRSAALQPLAHELVIQDESKIALVRREQHWSDDCRWDMYLPSGDYKLCLAVREIDGAGSFPSAKTCAISPGKHHIALEEESDAANHTVRVFVDGQETLTCVEPKDSQIDYGGRLTSTRDECSHHPADEPVEMVRCRYYVKISQGTQSPNGPSAGHLLWVEPAPKSRN